MFILPNLIDTEFNDRPENQPATVAFEVTCLRVFFNETESIEVLTNSNTSAFRSSWAEQMTFGEQFLDMLPDTMEELFRPFDKWIFYILVPTCGDNRLGVVRNTNKLYLAAWIDDQGEFVRHPTNSPIEGVLPLPQVDSSITETELKALYPEAIGICIEQARYMFSKELQRKTIRGNEPDLRRVFFKASTSERLLLLEQHPRLYDVKRDFDRMVRVFHQIYIQRYIHKEFIQVDPFIHRFLIDCLNEYRETLERTTPQTMRDRLLRMSPGQILDLMEKSNHLQYEPVRSRREGSDEPYKRRSTRVVRPERESDYSVNA